MSLSDKYKDFSPLLPTSPSYGSEFEDQLEEAKLQSFESGYQAGWDDCFRAQESDRNRISNDFGQNLQDISFSYHEALSKLTMSMKPLMAEIVDKLLPEMARASLGVHIQQQLSELIESASQGPVEIVVSPLNQEMITTLLKNGNAETFIVQPEETLSDSQVFVRVGKKERKIDLGSAVDGMREAIAAFFQQNQ